MLSFFPSFPPSQSPNAVRETKMAVNIEAMMPRLKVTAKPRTGPVPNW